MCAHFATTIAIWDIIHKPPPPSEPGGRYYLSSALVDPMNSCKNLQQSNFHTLYIYTVAPRPPNFPPSAWTSKCVYHPCLMWLRLSAQVRMMGRCGAQRPPLRVLSGTFLWCDCVNDWLSCEDWYQVLPHWNLPPPNNQATSLNGEMFDFWHCNTFQRCCCCCSDSSLLRLQY